MIILITFPPLLINLPGNPNPTTTKDAANKTTMITIRVTKMMTCDCLSSSKIFSLIGHDCGQSTHAQAVEF